MPFPDQKIEAGIGLLCILYIDGEINLSFDRSVTCVRREALTEAEYQEWADEHYACRIFCRNSRSRYRQKAENH